MSSPDGPSRLTDVLTAEHAGLLAFVEVLRREQAALVDGQADALPALAEDKLARASKVASLAEARRACALALGIAPSRAATEQWLQRQGRTADVLTWRNIALLAGTGHELNETNGLLIESRLKESRQALTVLQNAAAAGGLYGRDGQSCAPASARVFGAV